MRHIDPTLPVLILTASMVVLGCQKDLDLESRTFACTSNADCVDGRVCMSAPDSDTRICQEPPSDVGHDVDPDTDEPDADACTPQVFFVDDDGDGFGTAVEQCDEPDDAVAEGGDCDDTDASVFPGAGEVCDGRDSDCDGLEDQTDESPAPVCFSSVESVRTPGDAGGEVVDEILLVEPTFGDAPSPVVIAGRYDAGTTLELGGAPVSLDGQGSFVTRLDTDGQREWVVTLSTTTASTAPLVDLDSRGNVYVGVNFTDQLSIVGQGQAFPQTFTTSDGKTDAVALRISSDGVPRQTNHLSGPEQQTIDALAVGLDDRPYIAGSFSQELNTQTLSEVSGTDIRTGYIARLTEQVTVVDNGSPEIFYLRNTDGATATNIFVDAMTVIEDDNQQGTNEVYFAGRFQDRLQLGSDVFFDGSGEQAFAGKLHFNGDGTVEREWVSVLETSRTVRVSDIAAVTGSAGDSDDVMILGGWFAGDLELPGDSGGAAWTADSTDGFLAALRAGGTDGTTLWKQRIGGVDDQRVRALSVPFYDIENQGSFFPIYATCDIDGVAVIDDGATIAESGQPSGEDALLIRLDNQDSVLSAPVVGGLSHYSASGGLSLRALDAQSVIETAASQPPRRIITGGRFSGTARLSILGQGDPVEVDANDVDGIIIDGGIPTTNAEAGPL